MALIMAAAPWRVLLLDRSDPADPRWLLTTITLSSDVLPAELDTLGGHNDWPGITDWVRARLGHAVELHPIPAAQAWLVDGKR